MTTKLLAAVGNGLFVIVGTVIALRLLLLWRRTREWPELLIGGGMLLLPLVGLPCMVAAGIGSSRAADVNLVFLAAGLTAIGASITMLLSFTWRAFRPASPGAACFALGGGLLGFVVCALFFQSIASAPADAVPREAYAPHTLQLRLVFQIWYVWTAFEALLEWRRARRRLALGLSDPVVVNRFALWGAMGFSLAFNGIVALIMEAQGLNQMRDALPAFWLALHGLVASTLMFLTFVPPAAYLDWVRARHAAHTAAA